MKKIFFIVFLIALQSCSKSYGCSSSVHATLRNLTGLDGCSWVLQLDDGSYLEAQNLHEFEIEFVEGKNVHVNFKETDGGSICMVGKIVEIKCMSED